MLTKHLTGFMEMRRNLIRKIAVSVTMIAIFCGLIVPENLVGDRIILFSVALILAGVPHGASDYLIFRQLSDRSFPSSQTIHFVLSYLLVTGLYAGIWFVAPVAALFIFLAISAFHFGQSNWNYLSTSEVRLVHLTSLLWGSAVIGLPVLVYFDQSALIISEATGWEPVLPTSSRWAVIFLLIFSNFALICYLYESDTLTKAEFKRELGNFSLLSALFITTPLLVGFGVYFVFWHSMTAIRDQFRIIRQRNRQFDIRSYIRRVTPLSVLAFVFLGGLYFMAGDLFDKGLNLGLLFLFISVITVPHTLLMDRFYQLDEPVLTKD